MAAGFAKSPDQVYRSTFLSSIPWVDHGFASRHAIGWPGDYTQVKQIHSDIVVIADGKRGVLGQGDGLVTSELGNWIGIRTADCMPILLADSRLQAVAAVHAGWKGTLAQIAKRGVELMQSTYGSRPEDIYAVIGPGIARCCFEVGPEVSEQFGVDCRYVDLPGTNRQQLMDAGLEARNIEISELCTMCGVEEFHSFRRDREQSGRMVAAIRIRD
jgi:YfiH family protein